MKPPHPYWVKQRDNPQLGTYYVPMGQLSKTAAKRCESAIYGHNTMLRYETEADYQAGLEALRARGESVH